MAATGKVTRGGVMPYLLLLPSFFVLFALLIFPMVWNIYISLHNVNIITLARHWRFVGIKNYVKLYHDSYFWQSLKVTAKFVVASVIGQFLVGFGLAYTLPKEPRLAKILRPLFVVPWFMSMVVVGYSWILMYDQHFGFVNTYILFKHYVPWLNDPNIAIWSLAITNIWWGTAFTLINMETSLTAIDQDVIDAAEVNGAVGLKKLRYIVLPIIKPFMMTNLILITMWTINLFGLMLVMTNGGPLNSTRTLALYMYQQAFSFGNISVGSAIGIILLVINLSLAFAYLRMSRR